MDFRLQCNGLLIALQLPSDCSATETQQRCNRKAIAPLLETRVNTAPLLDRVLISRRAMTRGCLKAATEVFGV